MQVAFYKGTHKGVKGLYNKLVRWWTKGQYSHCELIFSHGVSASSSFTDGGVRFKRIEYSEENWDIISINPDYEPYAFNWFLEHNLMKYDILGNLHFVIGAVSDDKTKWFCNEACGAALGLKDPWRFDPNSFHALLSSQIRA